MRMLNEFILCTEDGSARKNGFELDKVRFQTLKVEHTFNEELLPVGSRVKVSSKAGEEVEEDKKYRLIQRKDVIYIL